MVSAMTPRSINCDTPIGWLGYCNISWGCLMRKNSTCIKENVPYTIVTKNLSPDIKPRGPIVFPNNQFRNN